MVKATHEIDPNADTVRVLKKLNTSFACWNLDEVEEDAIVSVETPAGKSFSMETSRHAGSSVTTSCDEDETHYPVSSRHLTLVSPVFRGMLSGQNWNEGVRDEIDGLYHVNAEDWDAEALLVLLDVLHHRNRRVPHTVSLEMVTKLVVLVDYYKCPEALESFTGRWIEHLKTSSPVPSHFCRDLMLWMCVAWVLELPDEFAQTTTVAIRREGKEFSALGLPIVKCFARIEEERMQAISTIFSQLQALLDEYRSQSYKCPSGDSFECGSMLFGALTKAMELQGLFPVPKTPFVGWSISELYTKIQRIRSPSWSCSNKPKKSRHRCDLRARVMAIADPVTRLADGPRLDDLKLE